MDNSGVAFTDLRTVEASIGGPAGQTRLVKKIGVFDEAQKGFSIILLIQIKLYGSLIRRVRRKVETA
jgi:hypothetical protein